jgi:hypothetical protein
MLNSLLFEWSIDLYKIDQASFGFRIIATNAIDLDEAKRLRSELLNAVSEYRKPFSVIADVRGLIPSDPKVLEIIHEMQIECKHMGLERVATIVSSPVVKAQMIQATFNAGTAHIDRFIDASKAKDWEQQALAWVETAIEPQVSTNVHFNS